MIVEGKVEERTSPCPLGIDESGLVEGDMALAGIGEVGRILLAHYSHRQLDL